MKKDNCPCKDCEKKGCGAYHDECENYQQFRAEKEKEYQERKLMGFIRHYERKQYIKTNNTLRF